MKNIKKPLIFLGLIFLGSCASNITTKKSEGVSFNEFRSFAYLPNTTFEINEFNRNADNSVEPSLVAFMNNEMTKRGYAIDNENPDLLLLLRTNRELNSNENTKTKYEQASSGGSSGGGSPNFASTGASGGKKYLSNSESEANNKPYKMGSLAVEIYDRKTKELVWVGKAENVKSHISDQTLMQQMLLEIFKKFPK